MTLEAPAPGGLDILAPGVGKVVELSLLTQPQISDLLDQSYNRFNQVDPMTDKATDLLGRISTLQAYCTHPQPHRSEFGVSCPVCGMFQS